MEFPFYKNKKQLLQVYTATHLQLKDNWFVLTYNNDENQINA